MIIGQCEKFALTEFFYKRIASSFNMASVQCEIELPLNSKLTPPPKGGTSCLCYFSLDLNKQADINAKLIAAVIPPAAPVKPPVNTPSKPFSSTAFCTP